MQFAATTLLALAAAVSAYNNSVSYTTVTVDTYETVCPVLGTIVYGASTYTNTETVESTITLPCPCTMVTPIYTTSSVSCTTCPVAPLYPLNTTAAAGTTAPAVPAAAKTTFPVGTTSSKVAAATTSVLTAGAGQAAAFSGASLAGLLAIAAYAL